MPVTNHPTYADNPKVQNLLSLGEEQALYRRTWPDYLAKYGFTADDVPALLALFTDESIDSLPEASPGKWAPVHAWRVLGQLRSEAAIAPVVASFDSLCHDEYALSELCKVVGMIGPAAIPTLVAHLQQPDRNEFSKVMAIDALSELAKNHPASRDQVLDIYRVYMARPDTTAHVLNGMLIGRLMDLQAKEVIAEIRQLFALNCVDIACAGDLEDVEIELGLRINRSTPKPDYLHLRGLPELFSGIAGFGADAVLDDHNGIADQTGTDLDAIFSLLDEYLLRYGSDASILGVSELDGFFAALACAPAMVMPSTWLPALWGGEDHMPQWESASEIKEFTPAIFHHYNYVIEELQAHCYEPLFLESTIFTTDMLLVDDWCEGFLRGCDLWGNLSAEDTAQLDHWLVPIRQFGTEAGNAALASMTDEEIVKLQKCITPNVEAMHRHFFKPVKRAGTTVVHAAPKIGRNDPCPCGSGKKHKKCCGLH